LLQDYQLIEKLARSFALRFYTDEGNRDLVGDKSAKS
jgi:catalase